MGINIDQLNESELIDLNRRIVERLRFLRQMRAHTSMLAFQLVTKFASSLTMNPRYSESLRATTKKLSTSWPKMAKDGPYHYDFCLESLTSLNLSKLNMITTNDLKTKEIVCRKESWRIRRKTSSPYAAKKVLSP